MSLKTLHKSQKKQTGFTMVEIMIVMAIIGIVIAIASGTWMRQREFARGRTCQENLSKIDGAKEQYAMDNAIGNGTDVDWSDIAGATNYIKFQPGCPATDEEYVLNAIGTDPTCPYSGSEPDWAPDYIGHVVPPVETASSN